MTDTNSTAAPTPVFEHDCGPEYGCRYLGVMTDFPQDYAPENKVLDLWVHTYKNMPGNRSSLIYRWNSDGPEYGSMPYRKEDSINAGWMHEHPIFGEILRRANLT